MELVILLWKDSIGEHTYGSIHVQLNVCVRGPTQAQPVLSHDVNPESIAGFR